MNTLNYQDNLKLQKRNNDGLRRTILELQRLLNEKVCPECGHRFKVNRQ